MQTKLQSAIETVTQTVVGFGVALISQLTLFPFFDINIPFSSNLWIGLWFTGISVLRGYIVRRIYNKRHDIVDNLVVLNSDLIENQDIQADLIEKLQTRNLELRNKIGGI